MRLPAGRASLLLLLLSATAAHTQSFGSWKKKHDLGTYYEGLIDVATGNLPIELLSFTSFFQAFDGATTWVVRYFSPARAPVTVYACDIDDDVQYWMESKPTVGSPSRWSEFSTWKTKNVLLEERVQPSSVGVTVRTDIGDLEYLPAIVYPVGVDFPRAVESYSLQMRANHTLSQLKYSLSYMNKSGKPVKVGSLSGRYIAGLPFLLKIDVRDLDDGAMRLVVCAIAGRDSVSSLEIRFYHRQKTAD